MTSIVKHFWENIIVISQYQQVQKSYGYVKYNFLGCLSHIFQKPFKVFCFLFISVQFKKEA